MLKAGVSAAGTQSDQLIESPEVFFFTACELYLSLGRAYVAYSEDISSYIVFSNRGMLPLRPSLRLVCEVEERHSLVASSVVTSRFTFIDAVNRLKRVVEATGVEPISSEIWSLKVVLGKRVHLGRALVSVFSRPIDSLDAILMVDRVLGHRWVYVDFLDSTPLFYDVFGVAPQNRGHVYLREDGRVEMDVLVFDFEDEHYRKTPPSIIKTPMIRLSSGGARPYIYFEPYSMQYIIERSSELGLNARVERITQDTARLLRRLYRMKRNYERRAYKSLLRSRVLDVVRALHYYDRYRSQILRTLYGVNPSLLTPCLKKTIGSRGGMDSNKRGDTRRDEDHG